jgi:L-threonylcarbamoyladenylate synthase
MAPELLRADTAGLIEAAAALGGGSVVALPTDTVYGLAAHPDRAEALAALFSLKGRPAEVALPVLIGDADQITAVAGRLGPAAASLADRHWPGPLTLVVPRAAGFAVDLGGPTSARGTVGIRWPAHALVESLCRRVGPLAVTSANRHGQPPASTPGKVLSAFAGEDDLVFVLDGGVCDGVPSTVVECRGDTARCLRPGAVRWEELTAETQGREAPDGPAAAIRWDPQPLGVDATVRSGDTG